MILASYYHLSVRVLTVCLFLTIACSTSVHANESAGYYSINLSSEVFAHDPDTAKTIEIPEGKRLYVTKYEKNGILWHRLRLGFFDTFEQAEEAMLSYKDKFSSAWVAKVSGREQIWAFKQESDPRLREKPSPLPVAEKPVTPKTPAVEQGPLIQVNNADSLMEEADSAMSLGNYDKAIRLYTKLAKTEEETIREKAQFKLAFAREQNGQMAHAKAEYRRYLMLFPDGQNASAVQKRLDSIQQASLLAKRSQQGGATLLKDDSKSAWRTDFYGSFSEFYYRNETSTGASGTVVTQSELHSDLDFNLRLRNENFDIQNVFVGGYERDLLDEDDSETRVSSAYFDLNHRPTNHSFKIDRQKHNSGGVLGRFDGVLLGVQLIDNLKLNLVAGYPVQLSTDGFETDKYLYGASFDIGTLWDHWNFNGYFITQKTEGIIDRQAVGGEVRYYHPKGSFFNLIDYDISYNKVNTYLAVANLTLPTETTLNLSFDYRNSPALTTSNALIGQTDSIQQLINNLGESSVRALAEDRTAISRLVTLGLTHPLNPKLQIALDFSWSNLGGTKSSGGVDAIEGTGDDYFYSVQLIGNSLIKAGDLAIVGVKYGDTSLYDIYTMTLNTRYPITKDWRLNPKLIVDYRDFKNVNEKETRFKPSVRTEYVWNKKLHFDLEGGMEWINNDSDAIVEDDSRGFFLIIGMRYRF